MVPRLSGRRVIDRWRGAFVPACPAAVCGLVGMVKYAVRSPRPLIRVLVKTRSRVRERMPSAAMT
ncbi:hypothetical protein A3838_32960 [Streptomyces badius]|nr:hypothetical protein A3838_32960 [Streptomyces badius]